MRVVGVPVGAIVALEEHMVGPEVVVSRSFIAENDDASTVVCAPVYSRPLGIDTEVSLGPEDGLPHASAIRCDFLALMFKRKLTAFVGTLSERRLAALDRALAVALELPLARKSG